MYWHAYNDSNDFSDEKYLGFLWKLKQRTNQKPF